MKVERAVDLLPLVELIVHGRIKTVADFVGRATLAPGKTAADVNAALDCSRGNSGGGNFSYEHAIGAVAQRLFNAEVFSETFVEADD